MARKRFPKLASTFPRIFYTKPSPRVYFDVGLYKRKKKHDPIELNAQKLEENVQQTNKDAEVGPSRQEKSNFDQFQPEVIEEKSPVPRHYHRKVPVVDAWASTDRH